MFTATPAKDEILDCTQTEDEIDITLSKFDTVFTKDGEIDVENLKVGDEIELLNDHQKEYHIIKSLDSVGYTDVEVKLQI